MYLKQVGFVNWHVCLLSLFYCVLVLVLNVRHFFVKKEVEIFLKANVVLFLEKLFICLMHFAHAFQFLDVMLCKTFFRINELLSEQITATHFFNNEKKKQYRCLHLSD